MSRHLIIGGLGQDGRLLSQYLTAQNHDVAAIIRGNSTSSAWPGVKYFLVREPSVDSYYDVISSYQPGIVYNLASLSSVAASETTPDISREMNFELVMTIFEAVTQYLDKKKHLRVKLIQAGSSEMFGVSEYPIHENSIMKPKSKYGEHKKLAFEFLEARKESHINFQISNLILFNHESIFRPENFVSQKIAKAAAIWHLKGDQSVKFGNIDMSRDWGCAREYVRAIAWVGTQEDNENYVIASGSLIKVHQILEHALNYVGFRGNDFSDYLDTTPVSYTHLTLPTKRIV